MKSGPEEHCVECGASLLSGVPRGLCSGCALRGALNLSDFELEDAPGTSISGPPPAFDRPKTFGDYELLQEVARGGMGIVFRARQKSLDRIVALKMLLFGPMASPAVIRRFRVEAVAAGSLHHPNIVAIHEVGIHDGQHFLVMDYVDGNNLAAFVHHRPLPPRRAAELMRTIAKAIEHAHGGGILHRDIKPSNILMGKDETPRISDFGLARRMEGDSSLTVSGHPLGSPSYMPPEQASARQGKASARSDVYGLGATLYHLLTGHPPFQGDSIAHTLDQVLHQEPVSPRLINPRTPKDLETICLKCLQKNPNQRFASAQELADELDRFLEGKAIRSRPVGFGEKAWRFCKRKPALASFAAAAVLLLLVVAIGSPLTIWRIRKSESRLAENLYAADMRLVELAIAAGNWGRARSLLESHVPSPGGKDLRGFEWNYFHTLAQGDQLNTVFAHSNIATAVTFSPDGQTLATAGFDGRIKFWSYPSLRPLSEIALPGERFVSLTFRADGQMLAATTESFHAYVWQFPSRQLLTNLQGEWNYAAFAPSGPNLALCGGRVWGDGEGPLKIWDSEHQRDLRTWSQSSIGGSRVAWTVDGKRLFSGPATNSIIQTDLESGSIIPARSIEPRLLSLACSRDGRMVAAATVRSHNAGPDITVWEMASGKVVANLQGHTANVWQVCFSPDSRFLASASSDQSVGVWELAIGRPVAFLRGHGDEVWSVAFSPDGHNLVSVDKKGALLHWALPAVRSDDINPNLTLIVGPRIFSPDGQTMAVGIGQERVALIDLAAAQIRRVLENASCALGFEQNTNTLVTLNPQGIKRISLSNEKDSAPQPLKPALRNFDIIGVSRDHRWLAAENDPGQLSLWDLTRDAMAQSTSLPKGERVVFLAFSPTGGELAVIQEKANEVLLYSRNLQHLRLLGKHNLAVWSVGFSTDGQLIATASMDDTVRLWSITSGEQIAILEGHKEGVSGVAFSPDNKTLAALCGSRSVKLWNIATRREVANLPFDHLSAYVEFSPDGQTLVACKPWLPEPRFQFWRAPKPR